MREREAAEVNPAPHSLENHRIGDGFHLLRSGAMVVVRLEILLLAPAIVALAFSASLPRAVTGLALVWIAFLWLCRFIVLGRLTIRTPVDLPIVLILVMLPLNLYASVDLALSQLTLFRIMGEVAILYAVVNWAISPARVRALSIGLIAVGVGVVLVSVLMTNWASNKLFDVDVWTKLLPRVVILQLNPQGLNANVVGGLGAVLLPLALAQLVWGPGRAVRLTGLIGSLIFSIVVFLSQSRGAWIAVALALVVMILLALRRPMLLVPVVAGLVLAALIVLQVQPIPDFVSAGTTLETAAGRAEGWQRAINMIQDYPITGVGLGTFSRAANILYPFFLLGPDAVVHHAHNIYLQAGVDQGIPGMVAYIGLLLALCVVGLNSVQRAETAWRGITIGLFGSLVVFLSHGMLDMIAYGLKASALIWVSLGLLVATARLWRVQEAEPGHASLPFGGELIRAPSQNHALAFVKRNWESVEDIVLWVIISLLGVTVIRADAYPGLALVVLGGIAVGLKSILWFERGYSPKMALM